MEAQMRPGGRENHPIKIIDTSGKNFGDAPEATSSQADMLSTQVFRQSYRNPKDWMQSK